MFYDNLKYPIISNWFNILVNEKGDKMNESKEIINDN